MKHVVTTESLRLTLVCISSIASTTKSTLPNLSRTPEDSELNISLTVTTSQFGAQSAKNFLTACGRGVH